ncbi:hypothetical protein ACP4OV_010117 [Aristida adscensionis]
MATATALRSNTFVALLFALAAVGGGAAGVAVAAAAACANHTFSDGQVYASCVDLPRLGAALHYNYTAATNTVAVAFRAPQGTGASASEDGGWVAWGINPTGAGMVGTQAVVAFRRADGSLAAYPTVLGSYAPSMAPAAAGELVLPMSGVAAERAGGEMAVYATVALPAGKGSKVSHVWQRGSSVVNDVPAAHPTAGDNVLSTASIDFSK